MSAKPSFFAELQRRHVYKVGAMYCVAGWLLVQVVTQVLPVFHISELAQRIIVLAVIAGFPVALVLAWLFDLTPQGIVRTGEAPDGASSTDTSQRGAAGGRLNYLLIGLLLIAVGYAAFEHYLPRNAAPQPTAAQASAGNDKSIAVLPFENLSDDKANAYFAEGIEDEILTKLAKIGALKVISRTSTRHYASSPDNLPEIARQLGVANILEGSVQRIGDSVHINVQLIRAATDDHLWAESYNRKLDDIFGVEGEVAQTIAEMLKATLTNAEAQQVAAKPTAVPAAYDAYLRGLAYFHRGDALRPNTLEAIAAFEEAVRLDPGFASAWAWLGRSQAFAYWNFDPSESHKDAARKAMETAAHLAPSATDTLAAQGFYHYWLERDYEGATHIFEQIRAQSPNDTSATYALAAIARRQGRWDRALQLFETAISLSPRDMLLLVDTGGTALAMRDLHAAQRAVDQSLAVESDDPGALGNEIILLQERGDFDQAQKILDRVRIAQGDDSLIFTFAYNAILRRQYTPAIALLQGQMQKPDTLGVSLGGYQMLLGDLQRHAGDADAARRTYEQTRSTLQAALRMQPDNPQLVAELAMAQAGLGNKEAAIEQARRAAAMLPATKDAYVGPGFEEWLARIGARFGDRDEPLTILQRLIRLPYGGPAITPALLRADPDWDNIRDDPRFRQILADGEASLKTGVN